MDHKSRKRVMETIEMLSVNTILFNYRRCSIWPSPTLVNFVYYPIMSCRTLGKIPGISWMTPAAIYIHATRSCLHLNDTFGNRWIGRGDPITWPPLSPDLTPLDFHFWGYMKTLVYETPVERQQDLVARIQVAGWSHP